MSKGGCNASTVDYQKRTKWCQQLPKHHNADICHNVSLKKRNIICQMKKLIDENCNQPVCDQWDTECSLNNTRGPYRFGRIDSSKQHQELIGGQLIARCDCGKRNGLQDDCRRWNCRGRPECKVTPFPKCDPFAGFPSNRHIPAYNPYDSCVKRMFVGPDQCDNCHCPTVEY